MSVAISAQAQCRLTPCCPHDDEGHLDRGGPGQAAQAPHHHEADAKEKAAAEGSAAARAAEGGAAAADAENPTTAQRRQ